MKNKCEIEYTKIGDYYMPNILPPEKINMTKIGKYGTLRLEYLKKNKNAEYTILFIENKLKNHLIEINKIATERVNLIIKQLAEKENITENLKETDQLKWARTNE